MLDLNLPALLLLAGCALTATAQTIAPTPPVIYIQSGISQLTLSAGFVSTLQGLGITPAANITELASQGAKMHPEPAANGDLEYTYPVVGGIIDAITAKGEIHQGGGVIFFQDSSSQSAVGIIFSDLALDTTGSISATPAITGLALVNGKVTARIAVFNAGPPTGFQLPLALADGAVLNLKGSALTLSPAAAALMNSTFGTTALKGGIPVGAFDTVAGSFTFYTLR